MKSTRRSRRTGSVRLRAAQGRHQPGSCRVLGCPNKAPRSTDGGLNTRYCRPHHDHLSRHGSLFLGAYTKAVLDPTRMRALRWLRRHAGDQAVRLAVQSIEVLYKGGGGRHTSACWRGMSPAEQAAATWARLRENGADPLRVLAGYIAVAEVIRLDPTSDGRKEYRIVQAAKGVRRMASGWHRRWETTGQEMHVYPISRGRVLRHIGEQVERAGELVLDVYRRDIREKRQ